MSSRSSRSSQCAKSDAAIRAAFGKLGVAVQSNGSEANCRFAARSAWVTPQEKPQPKQKS